MSTAAKLFSVTFYTSHSTNCEQIFFLHPKVHRYWIHSTKLRIHEPHLNLCNLDIYTSSERWMWLICFDVYVIFQHLNRSCRKIFHATPKTWPKHIWKDINFRFWKWSPKFHVASFQMIWMIWKNTQNLVDKPSKNVKLFQRVGYSKLRFWIMTLIDFTKIRLKLIN